MTLPVKTGSSQSAQLRRILWLSSPTVLGFLVFLFSFPLYRPLPFSTLTVFDALFCWFLIAPFFTIATMATILKRQFRKSTSKKLQIAIWLGVLLLACLNVLLVAGFLAAAYY